MEFVQEQLILSEAKILNLFQGCKLRYNSSSNLSVISWCHLNPLDPKSKPHPPQSWHNNPTVGSKCWAFVSDCFVAFSWKWHAIYNVCSCYITSSLWSIVCTQIVSFPRLQIPSSPAQLWKNNNNKASHLTGKRRVFEREVCRRGWGSMEQRRASAKNFYSVCSHGHTKFHALTSDLGLCGCVVMCIYTYFMGAVCP